MPLHRFRSALVLLALGSGYAGAESVPVDLERSTVTVHVFKSGVLSAFGDNHEIRAPLASAAVEKGEAPRVEVSFDARRMTVLDPGLSASKRAEVQKRMLGPECLDVERYPEIRFRSSRVEALGPHRYRVEGPLSLHGKTVPVSFEVEEKDGKVHGAATLKQRAFGIEPISVAGGTVKVKDELKVEFAIATAAREAAGGASPSR